MKLHATFVFFYATFVVETNFVNINLFWLVTYSYYSTCSYSIFYLKKMEKLINKGFLIWHNDILLIKLDKNVITKNAPVNHFKEFTITVMCSP